MNQILIDTTGTGQAIFLAWATKNNFNYTQTTTTITLTDSRDWSVELVELQNLDTAATVSVI